MVRRNTLEQVYFTAVQALPMILPIATLIGAMIIVQFSKFSGQYDLGKITVLIIVRELGPILTAFLIILRSATAVTIEISYMNVFNEMDALEMSGLDPLWVICVPRLVGITSAILCLFIVFDIVAIVGGYAIVWIITYIQSWRLPSSNCQCHIRSRYYRRHHQSHYYSALPLPSRVFIMDSEHNDISHRFP